MSLTSWKKINNDYVLLTYSDGSLVVVSAQDFERAFAPIVTAPYENVVRDFAKLVIV